MTYSPTTSQPRVSCSGILTGLWGSQLTPVPLVRTDPVKRLSSPLDVPRETSRTGSSLRTDATTARLSWYLSPTNKQKPGPDKITSPPSVGLSPTRLDQPYRHPQTGERGPESSERHPSRVGPYPRLGRVPSSPFPRGTGKVHPGVPGAPAPSPHPPRSPGWGQWSRYHHH